MNGMDVQTSGKPRPVLRACGRQTEGMDALIEAATRQRAPEALADLSDSLVAVNDMLRGVDVLLACGPAPEVQRSARALVGLATDMVTQVRELVQALALET